MIGGLSAIELFGAFGTAVTIFGGGLTIGHRLRGRTSDTEINALEKSLKTEIGKSNDLGATLHSARGQLNTSRSEVLHLESKLQQEAARSTELEATLHGIREVLDEKTDVWLRSPPQSMKHLQEIRSSIPIVTVCNFKGGVGKTSLTSLLAGYFDLYKNKRVLLIDFDYQGSLTDALLASADLPQFEASARRLIEHGVAPDAVVAHAYSLHPALSNTKLFSCFYSFNRIENTVMMRWIAEKREARYLTHAILSDPIVQSSFDLVIIDAPPRLSTATVNAFCASTHVLIPTILDSMSTQAALNTVGVIREFREQLNPGLELLGIVPTMVGQVKLNDRETDFLQRMIARLPEFWRQPTLPHVYENQRICRREKIATSLGSDLAFNSSAEVRQMTIALGDVLAERLFRDAREASGDPASQRARVTSIQSAQRRA